MTKYGDITGMKGMPGKSNTGELSVFAVEVLCLPACLHMPPRSFFGLTNQNTRYRQRDLDMIINADTRRTFQIRSRIVPYIRRYRDERGFLEVGTPMMNQVCCRANYVA